MRYFALVASAAAVLAGAGLGVVLAVEPEAGGTTTAASGAGAPSAAGIGEDPLVRQGGDTYATATPFSSIPFVDDGTTVGYGNDYDASEYGDCPWGSTAPDVVYRFTPSVYTTVDINLCTGQTNYDTKLYVDVPYPYDYADCDDDTCSSPLFPSPYVSTLTGVPVPGGWDGYIVVDGYGSSSGNYTIEVTESACATGCAAGTGCETCRPDYPQYCCYRGLSPVDGATGVSVNPTFTWGCVRTRVAGYPDCVKYLLRGKLLDAPSTDYLTWCETQGGASTSCTPGIALEYDTSYTWHVWALECTEYPGNCNYSNCFDPTFDAVCDTPFDPATGAYYTFTTAGPPGSGCDAGMVWDDGSAEDLVTSFGGSATYVQSFTPPEYPYSIERVCTAWSYQLLERAYGGPDGAGNSLPPVELLQMPYSVVLYWHGTRYEVEATAWDVPLWPAVAFSDVDVSFQLPVITDGSFYLGASWGGGATGIAVDVNGSGGTDVEFVDQYGTWTPVPPTTARALLVRADGAAANPPVAAFSWTPLAPLPDQNVQFLDQSTGDPIMWSWDFGDGGTSMLRNPTHSFAEPGVYQVTLTAANIFGSDSSSHDVTVSGELVASFSYTPSQPWAGQSVQFMDTSSGGPTSWAWSFGDGDTSTAQNPAHVYAAAGAYSVTLAVSNAAGSDSATAVVTVSGELTAGFSFTPAEPVAGQSAQFTDTTSGGPTSWSWSFGDGGTSTAQNPAHVYAGAGTWTVTLTVANATSSDSTSRSLFVALAEPPWGGPEAPASPAGAVVEPVIASAVDRQGNRVEVWQQTAGKALGIAAVDAATPGIYARRFDPEDNPVGDVIEVETAAGEDAASPTVAFDAGGRFVVGWRDLGSGEGVFGRTFGADGSPEGGAFRVDDTGSIDEPPEVAAGDGGRFTTVWGGGGAIRARAFAPDGTPLGSSVRVDDGSASELSKPVVGCDATGRCVVVWRQVTGKAQGGEGIFGRFFGAGGDPASEVFQVNDDPTGGVGSPSVGSDAFGNIVVAWPQSASQAVGWDIFVRRVDAGGQPLGTQKRANSETAGRQSRPSVSVNASGDVAVAWESQVAVAGKQAGDGVFGRFFTPDLQPVAPDFEVAVPSAGLDPVAPQVEVANDRTVTVSYAKVDTGGVGRGVFLRTFTVGDVSSPCAADDSTLCLNDSRFQVRVGWRSWVDDSTGEGRAVALSADTGYFWFFNSANVELVVKVLDGTWLNGMFWVYYGALSDVEYAIAVTDTRTGFTTTYFNPAHNLASVADVEALPGGGGGSKARVSSLGGAAAGPSPPSPTDRGAELGQVAAAILDCTPGDTMLCLNQNRFRLQVVWRSYNDGSVGVGHAVGLTGDTGYFWFFNDANVELVVKVLDGRAINGHYWVFYGALSDVEYTMTVTDTSTGEERTYTNPAHQLASVADTEAFALP